MCAHRVRHGLPRSFPPDALPNWAVRRTTSFRSGRGSPARSAPTAETQDRIEKGIAASASGIAGGFGATAATNYRRGYPATVNPAREAALAAEIAAGLVGEENVVHDAPPVMGAEDFSFLLTERPGCYIWLGTGRGADAAMVQHPKSDLNDRHEEVTCGRAWARM